MSPLTVSHKGRRFPAAGLDPEPFSEHLREWYMPYLGIVWVEQAQDREEMGLDARPIPDEHIFDLLVNWCWWPKPGDKQLPRDTHLQTWRPRRDGALKLRPGLPTIEQVEHYESAQRWYDNIKTWECNDPDGACTLKAFHWHEKE